VAAAGTLRPGLSSATEATEGRVYHEIEPEDIAELAGDEGDEAGIPFADEEYDWEPR
jgi:hypothetical protein